ncbi:MAG: cysteine synthase family protein [Saprospiraceae bacterium]|nr:cysteine synthase family protein [Saprospiraceae bacterium]MCB0543414.1 cysteine synthase family protein [Saprospiraceae bacterium]MCB0573671.1 cysteine synthase family protein [Saprospiraceae bacterium]MCB9353774.1 cysteine synthase family protein [Lewinellaceae bacterium]
MVFNNILETIGKTPLIRLNSVVSHIPATVYAKIEAFNPGLSAKDRIALHMIERAERLGQLKPGGTVVDATSGNTGFSLAMVCAIKGYKCVLTVTSKISEDKLNNLRAMGAEVIMCPQDAAPNDPNSYYRRAEQLAKEIPGAYYVNQNFNPDNADAHFLTTGPEIWEQTQGRVTWLIGSASTGGTLCGSGRFLREQNPEMKVIAVDAYGSVLKKYHETGVYDEQEIYSYRIEGTGKNIIPANVDFELIDRFVKVTDQDSALRARDIARREGILVGYSSGAALQCLEQIKGELTENDTVVLIFADHGCKYVSKIFSDAWMQEQGFLSQKEMAAVC